MNRIGLKLCSNNKNGELLENEYTFDPICPKVINLHEKACDILAISNIVKLNGFIFLERSILLGAATIIQAIRYGKFCGPVVLTHSLAPRHTAYLIQLLSDIPDAGKLIAFGLGNKLDEYKKYLNLLGILNNNLVKLFSEDYINTINYPELDRATVVLAIPPSSQTGIKDAVDLAVARNGDLELLENLSNQHSPNQILKQPKEHLEEQMSTLKYALTKPNVQLLVYEVHSVLPSETVDMLEQILDIANSMARDKYLRDYSVLF